MPNVVCLCTQMRAARTISVTTLAAVTSLAVAGLWGTTAGASTGVVPKSTVEKQTARMLAAQTGQKLPKVTCPGGLAAKIGATIHCTVVPYGSKLKYPASVTVTSIHGSTANFHIQVGQAPGQANKAKFCADETTLAAATSSASTPAAFLQALQNNERLILDFQNTAPSKIAPEAGTLVQAAKHAVTTQDVNIFGSTAVLKAQAAVARFCGQTLSGGSAA